MKLKKWHVCLAIVCILCFGYIMYIMNPEFDDLKRFINPIYEICRRRIRINISIPYVSSTSL